MTTEMFTREFWDERYRSAHRIWSGNPNQTLVSTAKDLEPGDALDVGAGEGADSVWLASQGWRVTGIDVSGVALDRAAEHAAQAGAEIAQRITWRQTDVLAWDPAPAQYDLVSAHFIHLPEAGLNRLHRQLAATVRPGGTLLVVGHHPSGLDASTGGLRHPELLFTAEQVAEVLDPDEWQTITTSAPQRETANHEGQHTTFIDAVLRAVRRR